jgi:hypothetical protein
MIVAEPTKQPISRTAKLAAARLSTRMELFPGVTESQLWNRKRENGFATVPRTLPLICLIADSLTKKTPVSGTYLDLWCRVYDEGFVKLDKPQEMALGSGFTTARGPSIWATRLDLLQQHGFIKLAPGAFGNRSYALVFNPYWVIRNKREVIEPKLYNALMAQAMAIGAQFVESSAVDLTATPRQHSRFYDSSG